MSAAPIRKRIRFLWLVPLLVIWLVACRASANAPTDLTPDGLPAPPTPNEPASQPVETPISNPVLAACDVNRQAEAMRTSQQPDWERIALEACYQMSLELRPDLPGYTGQSRVTFTNHTGDPLDTLVFRLYPNAPAIYGGSMEINTAQIDGETVVPEIFLPDRSALRLALAAPLAPGETAVVDLAFTGVLPRDLADTEQAYGVYNAASDPPLMVLANWFPILAEWRAGGWFAEPVNPIGDAVVSSSSLYEVSLVLPAGWQAATTGTEIAPGEYTAGPVRDFMIVAGPDFSIREQNVDGVRLRQFGTGEEDYRWEAGLESAADALGLYDDQFGAYPYNELDVVAVPLHLAQGVEYPGLFLIRQELYRPDDPQPFLLGLVIAHEAAHQWWYGVIGSNVLLAPWQDEALATYSSMLYQQAYQPEIFPGTLAFYENNVAEALASAPDPSVGQSVDAFHVDAAYYSPLVYQRGALFLDALANQIGKTDLLHALHTYYERNRFGLVSPQILLDGFEQQCGCELAAFYRQWGLEPAPK